MDYNLVSMSHGMFLYWCITDKKEKGKKKGEESEDESDRKKNNVNKKVGIRYFRNWCLTTTEKKNHTKDNKIDYKMGRVRSSGLP